MLFCEFALQLRDFVFPNFAEFIGRDAERRESVCELRVWAESCFHHLGSEDVPTGSLEQGHPIHFSVFLTSFRVRGATRSPTSPTAATAEIRDSEQYQGPAGGQRLFTISKTSESGAAARPQGHPDPKLKGCFFSGKVPVGSGGGPTSPKGSMEAIAAVCRGWSGRGSHPHGRSEARWR